MYRRIIFLWNLSISWTVSLVNEHSLLLYRNTFVLIDILSFLNMWQSLSAALMQCSMFECYVRSKYLNILPIAVVVFVLLSFWLILYQVSLLSIVIMVFFRDSTRFGLALRTVMSSAVSGKMPPRKKSPGKLAPRKLSYPGKLPPGNLPRRNPPPEECLPWNTKTMV